MFSLSVAPESLRAWKYAALDRGIPVSRLIQQAMDALLGTVTPENPKPRRRPLDRFESPEAKRAAIEALRGLTAVAAGDAPEPARELLSAPVAARPDVKLCQAGHPSPSEAQVCRVCGRLL